MPPVGEQPGQSASKVSVKLVVLAELLLVGTSAIINLATNAVSQDWEWTRDWRYLGTALFVLVATTITIALLRERRADAEQKSDQSNGEYPVSSNPQRNRYPAPDYGWRFWGVIGLGISILVIAAGLISQESGPQDNVETPSLPLSPTLTAPSNRAPARSYTPNPAPPPAVYHGTGNDVVDITKASGMGIVQFECIPCGSTNTIVKTNGPDVVVVNRIGSYKGKRLINSVGSGSTTSLAVTAGGPWTLTVGSGLSMATLARDGGPVTGTGDDVVLIQQNTSRAHITNRGGSSNFIVKILPLGGGGMLDIPVNAIGDYDSTVPLDGPAVLEIMSAGNWSVDNLR